MRFKHLPVILLSGIILSAGSCGPKSSGADNPLFNDVSKSGVMSNIADGSTVAGVPSMQFSQWKRCMVALNKLPEVVRLAGDVKTLLEKQAYRKGIFGSISHFVKKIFN